MVARRLLLENYFLPGDLERQIGAFVDPDDSHRYHESFGNLTPADVNHGRGAKILNIREEIKKQKSNQSLRYETAKAFRKTLTTDGCTARVLNDLSSFVVVITARLFSGASATRCGDVGS